MGAAPADEVDCFEGAYVRKLLELAPADSCVFSANSMSIRAIDMFLVKGGKPLCVLCNRGQNGIDGTTSTALGAAQNFAQTTYLTGDFTMLHDLSALAFAARDAGASRRCAGFEHGDRAFEQQRRRHLRHASPGIWRRLLRAVVPGAPKTCASSRRRARFPCRTRAVSTVEEFAAVYEELLGTPGVSLIEVTVPLRGVKERYGKFQK